MKALILMLLFSFFCSAASANVSKRRCRAHVKVEFIKRHHQTHIRQQHAQKGHKKGEDKIFTNQSLRPQKPLFYNYSKLFN